MAIPGMFVTFDLDGTLADVAHREHMVRESPRNWDAFYAACVDDSPIPVAVEVFNAHLARGHKIEIWTGRSAVVRPAGK